MQNKRSINDVIDQDIGIGQNLQLLPFQYGSSIEHSNLASADPFHALGELLGLPLSSESQFLNMIRTQVGKFVDPTPVQVQESLNSLRRMKTLMNDHVQYLQMTLHTIRNLASPDWPKFNAEAVDAGPFILAEDNQTVNSPRRNAEQAVIDCEYLLRLAEHLSRQCVEGTNIIMNTSMLEVSRKSIRVNEYLARLIVLAFHFLPLTFLTGIFGMNLKKFGQGQLSIWVFNILLIPVMLLGMVLYLWNEVKQVCWRLIRCGQSR